MSGRHQPLNGADSAQALADAIEYVEAHGLTVTSKRESVLIVPRCIACSEPALSGDVYCADHSLTEEPPVRHPGLRDREPYSGGFAANE